MSAMNAAKHNLSGPHKAAIAVLALDEELAAKVLSQLDEDDLRKLARAVNELDHVGDDTLAVVFEELDRALHGKGASVIGAGATAYMRRLTGSAIGEERAARLFAPVAAAEPAPIEVLRTARVEALADLLIEEHPQIAAMVLTQLPARLASKVLRQMPAQAAGDLLARLSDLDEVPEHAVTEASESVVRALASAGGLSTSDRRADFDGLAFSAALLNEMPKDDGDRMLERVAEHDDAAAKRLREAMFTFEDLMRVDQRQMATLLRAASNEALITALQTAGDDLREHFLGALSKRAAGTLRDDLAAMPPRRVAEVEAAPREIVELATRMAAEGTLQLPPRGEEDDA
jgi:flagellar motor switch protein FliG